MRATRRIGVVVLAGGLALTGCRGRDLGTRQNPQEADEAIPPGAIPAAPEVAPGNTASPSTAASPASASADSASSAAAPGAGQASRVDSAAPGAPGAPPQ